MSCALSLVVCMLSLFLVQDLLLLSFFSCHLSLLFLFSLAHLLMTDRDFVPPYGFVTAACVSSPREGDLS